METVVISGILILFGLMFGSFAGAQVWRLRARQLRDEDQALDWLNKQEQLTSDQEQDKAWLVEESSARRAERKRLNGALRPVSQDYSLCLHCQHRLSWYDLLPLVSWASTGGKCRYCKASIGMFEPLIEVGVASLFALSYLLWPLPIEDVMGLVLFGLWLVAVVMLAILFAYDSKWFLLPDVVMFPFISVAAVTAGIQLVGATDTLGTLLSIGGAVLVLSGLYYLLWFSSKGQWVGFGDVKLGLGLALLVADWRLALLALFLANFIGSLVVVPGMFLGKLNRKAHVPFGPLLIVGAVIAILVGEELISLYMGLVS